jgi:crotonobetainyl-CoA:carnitine CoA-transferase CaiB-like acyl-CoA transferase
VSGALAGLRVLDLTDQKGAFAGKLLAGLGATWCWWSRPAAARCVDLPPFFGGTAGRERSLFFWFYAAGKRGITLDLAHATGPGRLGSSPRGPTS